MILTELPVYTLPRVYLDTETLGSMYAPEHSLVCKTMELPWKKNKSNVSCIPEGLYIVEKQKPTEYRKYGYFRFRAVFGRSINEYVIDSDGQQAMSSILIHRITYVSGLKGCIGVGSRFHDFNKDGVPDMAESSVKLEWMYKHLPDLFVLHITHKV